MAANNNNNNDNKGLPELTGEATSAKGLVKLVTGSLDKEEVTSILEGDLELPVTFENVVLSLPVLQGSPEEVAKEKCLFAARKVGGAVLVEETSLCYNALNGLPGVLVNCFLEKTCLDGLNKIISAYADKSAYAQCILAYSHGDGRDPKLFIGKTNGKIILARGPKDMGWDPIFQPEGHEKTYAEMDKAEKDKISSKYKALLLLKDYLKVEEMTEKKEEIKNEENSAEEVKAKEDEKVEIKKAEEVETKKENEKKTDGEKVSRKRRGRDGEDGGNDRDPDMDSANAGPKRRTVRYRIKRH